MSIKSISIKIPIRLVSEANNTDHWTKKHKRKKKISLLLKTYLPDLGKCQLPCKVILTRVAPRRFDFDNLVISFKHVRDQISGMLIPGLAAGRADDDDRIEWEYRQERGNPKEYAVIIEIKKQP